MKYKWSELCCGKIIREDKWLEHCKKFNAFKTKRGDEIKRKTITYKVAGGKWLIYRSESEVHPTATAAAAVAVAEENGIIIIYNQHVALSQYGSVPKPIVAEELHAVV